MCCVSGEKGAPTDPSEIDRIQTHLPHILPEMDNLSRQWIETHSIATHDESGWNITCLNDSEQCVFLVHINDQPACCLETVSAAEQIPTLRPLSCRLFPLRLRHFNGLRVLDYEVWDECQEAWQTPIPLIETCRPALIDALGKEWVDALITVSRRLSAHSSPPTSCQTE